MTTIDNTKNKPRAHRDQLRQTLHHHRWYRLAGSYEQNKKKGRPSTFLLSYVSFTSFYSPTTT
jgi:hypothetical protein